MRSNYICFVDEGTKAKGLNTLFTITVPIYKPLLITYYIQKAIVEPGLL